MKASILWHSAFFMVQLSHPHMTAGKTIALTWRTFVHKVMSPLFNTLSRFVIAFLPRSKRLLISWLQLSSKVILEAKKIKSVTVSIVSPSIYHEMMGVKAVILVFWMLSFKPAFSFSSFTFIRKLFSSCLSYSNVLIPRLLKPYTLGDWLLHVARALWLIFLLTCFPPSGGRVLHSHSHVLIA